MASETRPLFPKNPRLGTFHLLEEESKGCGTRSSLGIRTECRTGQGGQVKRGQKSESRDGAGD